MLIGIKLQPYICHQTEVFGRWQNIGLELPAGYFGIPLELLIYSCSKKIVHYCTTPRDWARIFCQGPIIYQFSNISRWFSNFEEDFPTFKLIFQFVSWFPNFSSWLVNFCSSSSTLPLKLADLTSGEWYNPVSSEKSGVCTENIKVFTHNWPSAYWDWIKLSLFWPSENFQIF